MGYRRTTTAAIVMVMTAVAFASPAGAAPQASCGGRAVTVFGTSGPDVIIGTPGVDVIHAGRGNDVIFGFGGNDVICGGGGADQISGGAGRDYIDGGAGRDRLRGNAGDDELRGGAHRDRLLGGSGDDRLKGGRGRDSGSGGPGIDNCSSGRFDHCELIPPSRIEGEQQPEPVTQQRPIPTTIQSPRPLPPRPVPTPDPVRANVPAAPVVSPSVALVSGTQLFWGAGDDGGSPILRYEVLASVRYEPLACGIGDPVVAEPGYVAPRRNQLDANTHHYCVRAVNAIGAGPWAAQTTAPDPLVQTMRAAFWDPCPAGATGCASSGVEVTVTNFTPGSTIDIRCGVDAAPIRLAILADGTGRGRGCINPTGGSQFIYGPPVQSAGESGPQLLTLAPARPPA